MLLKECKAIIGKKCKLSEVASVPFYVGDKAVGFMYLADKLDNIITVKITKIVVCTDDVCNEIEADKEFNLKLDLCKNRIKPFEYIDMPVENTNDMESALKNVWLISDMHMKSVYEYVWDYVKNI